MDKTNMSDADKQYIRDQLNENRSPDKLKELFKMQKELDAVVFEKHADKLPQDLQEWVLKYTIAMDSEIDEIRREVGFKWWKEDPEINMETLHEEVSDMWFFLIALTQRVGMSSDDIFKVYEEKRKENFARQEGNSKKGSEYDYRGGMVNE